MNTLLIESTDRIKAHGPGAVLFSTVANDEGRILMEAKFVELPDGGPDLLATMQAAVGGMVEHIHMDHSRHRPHVSYDAWINDDGKLIQMPISVRLRVDRGAKHDIVNIAGPVLITAGEALTGATVPLLPKEIYDIAILTLKHGHPLVTVTPELKDA